MFVFLQNDSLVGAGERRSSGSVALNASLPGTTLVEQLKYENDRLKIALAQRSVSQWGSREMFAANDRNTVGPH